MERSKADAGQGGAETLRLGLVLPSVNTVIEPWLAAAVPTGVSLHVARMLMPDRLTPEAIVEMDRDDGHRALCQISSCRPASIVYACIASSVVQGVAYDRELVKEMRQASGLPCETAAGAMVGALRELGLSRVAVVSPYAQDVDQAEHAFLEASGLSITGAVNFGIGNAFDLSTPTKDQIVEAGIKVAGDAEGVLLTCMNMRSHLAVDALEAALDRPVVSATMAMAWALMRLGGVTGPIAGFGRLGTLDGNFQV